MFFPSYADVQRKEHTYTKYKHLKFYKPESGIQYEGVRPFTCKGIISIHTANSNDITNTR